MYSTHYSNYWVTMDPGCSLSRLDREIHRHNGGTFLDTLSQTHGLIASLYLEMEEQCLTCMLPGVVGPRERDEGGWVWGETLGGEDVSLF